MAGMKDFDKITVKDFEDAKLFFDEFTKPVDNILSDYILVKKSIWFEMLFYFYDRKKSKERLEDAAKN